MPPGSPPRPRRTRRSVPWLLATLTLTLALAGPAYADTLGTAGHMYDRYIAYDNITHFLGTAALASAAGDILLALRITFYDDITFP